MTDKYALRQRLAAALFLFPWSLILVVACGGGGGGEDIPPPPVVTECPDGFLDKPSRGVACLHCNHPNAQAQADILSSIVVDSCLRNVSMNYLVSGTFGFDEAFMEAQVAKLSHNRHLSLTLYLLNGPGQRRWKSGLFDGFGEKIKPEEFRNRIQWDESFRDAYRNHVSSLAPLIDFSLAHGATVNIIPMLEDNLNDSAFTAVKKLTQEVLAGKPVRYGRNPCPSCYPGNTDWIPGDCFEEEHTDKPYFNVSGGIVTNDGDDVGGDYRSLAPVRDRAAALGNEFIVWTQKYQGVLPGGTLIDPDKRNYSAPEQSEILEIQSLIKGG